MIQHSIRSPHVHSRAVPLATALIGMCFAALNACPAFGQAGLRESLEQLDRDQDGRIDPEEITPLARPYLERIATAKRLRLDRDTRIEDFQEASRIYHALRNGVSGRGVEVESESSIQPFGPMDEQPVVPEFGLAEIKYPYVQADLDEADRTLRRYDRDDDGRIDRREAARARWTHRDPFSMDLDNDDRLNRLELAQRYARRRLLDGDSDELVQRARRVGNGIESSEPQRRRSEDSSQWWRTGGSRYYLTASVLSRFDKNRNGRLEVQETEALGFPPGRIDVDRDGEITRQELFGFLSGLQDESAGAVEGLPGWFFEMDTNGDGQVEMSEYKPEDAVDRFDQFALLDTNGDGLLTDREVVSSKSMVGGSYENRDAEIMPPGRTIISEIEVPDEFVIGDLNVRVSITHSNTSHLDAYLTGPDGTRIELFTEIGGSGNHFEQTVFDDQSRYPITKAKPPYSGTYLPEGTT
ncbi:MAG: proprotein convertase P-domain-containing protein, partial [Planctomycetota bacterium]